MSSTRYLISEVDLTTYHKDQWNQFLSFHEELFHEIFTDVPYDREFEKKQLISGFPGIDSTHWIIKDQNSIIGFIQLLYYNKNDPGYEINKNIARAFILVAKEQRRKHIGLNLLFKVVNIVIKDHKEIFLFNTTSQAGWAFLEYLGGKNVLSSTESFLDLKDVNWSIMNSWKNNGYEYNKGIHILDYIFIPDGILDDFLVLESEILSMLPQGDLTYQEKTSKESFKEKETDLRDKNIDVYYKVAQDTNETLVGFTRILFNPETPDIIEQALTGVSKKYQGKGIAKLLKSEMLFFIKENFPNVKRIFTSNATINPSMLSINKKIGFVESSTWKHYEFDIPVLSEKLNKLMKIKNLY